MPVTNQVVIIWAVTNGYLDQTPVDKIQDYQAQYLKYIFSTRPKLKTAINKQKILSDKIIKELETYTQRFNDSHPGLVIKEEVEEVKS